MAPGQVSENEIDCHCVGSIHAKGAAPEGIPLGLSRKESDIVHQDSMGPPI